MDAPTEQKEISPAVSEARAKADAEQDAVLAKILAPDEPESSPSPPQPAPEQDAPDLSKEGRVRDERGRFLKDELKPEASEPTEAPADTPEPEIAVPDSVNPEEYRKAMQALQRDGVPSKAYADMDPTEVTQWGLKRLKSQSEVDGFGSKNADLEKQLAAVKSPPSDSPVNLDEAVKPFVEFFGEDAAEPLRAFGEKLMADMKDSLKDDMEAIRSLQASSLQQQRRDARSELSKEFKDWNLDKDSRWQPVLDYRAGDANEYPDEVEGLRAAALMVYAAEALAKKAKAVTQRNADRDNGQSTVENKGAPPPPAPNRDDRETDLIHAIMDGDKKEVDKLRFRAPRPGLNESQVRAGS